MEHERKPTGGIKLGPQNLKTFIIDHLNMFYSAKSHSVTKVPEIAGHVHYTDLRESVLERVSDVEKQWRGVELVLTLLDACIPAEHCVDAVDMVDEAFFSLKRNTGRDHRLRDLFIAYYKQQIDRVEIASFQILKMASVKLKDKQVKTAERNYSDSRADRTLMLMIAANILLLLSNLNTAGSLFFLQMIQKIS